jgi:hypothetical protein
MDDGQGRFAAMEAIVRCYFSRKARWKLSRIGESA